MQSPATSQHAVVPNRKMKQVTRMCTERCCIAPPKNKQEEEGETCCGLSPVAQDSPSFSLADPSKKDSTGFWFLRILLFLRDLLLFCRVMDKSKFGRPSVILVYKKNKEQTGFKYVVDL